MPEPWAVVCRQCTRLATEVPAHVLVVALLTTGLGLFVLVSLPFLRIASNLRDVQSSIVFIQVAGE